MNINVPVECCRSHACVNVTVKCSVGTLNALFWTVFFSRTTIWDCRSNWDHNLADMYMTLKLYNSGSAKLVLFVLSKPPKQSKLINKLMNILEINPFSLPPHQRLCQSLEESDKGEYWLIRSKSLAQQEQRDEWRNSWMIWI